MKRQTTFKAQPYGEPPFSASLAMMQGMGVNQAPAIGTFRVVTNHIS